MPAFIAWTFWAAFLAIFAALGVWIWIWQQHRAHFGRLLDSVTELRDALGLAVTDNFALQAKNRLLTEEVESLTEWIEALREGNRKLRTDLEEAERWLGQVGVPSRVLDALAERRRMRQAASPPRRLRLPREDAI